MIISLVMGKGEEKHNLNKRLKSEARKIQTSEKGRKKVDRPAITVEIANQTTKVVTIPVNSD